MVMARCSIAVLMWLAAPPVAAQDAGSLAESCFVQTYDQAELEAHPELRVKTINVYFQDLAGTLLASVTYTLRFGAKFGFSGDCEQTGGGFVCRACANDSCARDSQSFRILWPGGESIELVNDETGIVAENADGGRDYLLAGGGGNSFVMMRGPLAECAW